MTGREPQSGIITEEWGSDGPVRIDSRIDRAIVGALRGQDLSGFEIWRWLGSEDAVSGLLTEPQLYPTLYRLEAEGLLESDWREAERVRRLYRLTATALRQADAHAWPAIVLRDSLSPSRGEIDRPSRTHSPDPDAGSWFVPPKPAPTAVAPATAASAAPSEPGAANESGRVPSDRPARPATEGRPGNPAIARYEADLGADLDLPRPEAARVRQEITDHLTDSAHALELGGLDTVAASAEAIRHLGDPRYLAAQIAAAQQTRDRQGRAIRRAVVELVSEVILWMVLSAAVVVLSPGASDVVTSLGRMAGLHLAVLRSAEWTTNQMAIMLCIGAFAAGRLSMGQLSRISRHSDATLRKRWAIIGAAAVLALALLLPGYQDVLVVATLLAAPLAFVAGTLRPTHTNENAYTWRALGQAILLVAVVTLLPLGRLFAYDPSGTPRAPAAQAEAPGQLTINQLADGTFEYTASAPGPGVVTVELWPASTDGPFIVVDRSAARATIVAEHAVDLTKLPPYRQWWVAAVRLAPGGQRTAVAVVIQAGLPGSPNTALGWLISHL